jgi:hypothetical protein
MSEFKPTKYRKRPVVIEAAETGNDYDTDESIMKWCNGVWHEDVEDKNYLFSITTLEGEMRAKSGDFIIKGVAGEFYPCDATIFRKTYDVDLVSAAAPVEQQRCFCGSPAWGINGCCGTSGCNNVPG